MVQLQATNLPGVVTTTSLTSANGGLTVSGASTNETITAPLAKDTTYGLVITAADSSGSASFFKVFDTINPDYLTIEAEDFDYGGGKFIDSLPPGAFPNVDAYGGLTATIGIDCNNHNPSGQPDAYRPNPLETENAGDTPRIQYASGDADYDVGYNNTGDWGNYTRHYPAGVYNIYLRGSDGTVTQPNACTIGLVTSGWGTVNQTTNRMGAFLIPSIDSNWQIYSWCPAVDSSGNLVAWGAGGEQETLRFTVAGGNCNENFYLLVPAAPTITPNNTTLYQGNAATLGIAPYALSAPGIQWQTDNGTGGLTWQNIIGATNKNYAVPSGSLSAGSYEYQVALAVSSNAVPVTVTSAPITLNILAPTKPEVAEDTSPASSTAVVGTTTSFTAAFTGLLPITYQWLVSSNLGVTFTPITGQTNTTLTVYNLSVSTNEYELEAVNTLGSNYSTPATLTTTPAPPTPPIQLAGDLVVELRSTDLVTGAGETTWTNRAGSAASVGNFIMSSGGALQVSNNSVNSGAPLWGAYAVNALYVNSPSIAVQSALTAPAEISGNGASSGEAWIYCTALSGNGSVISYGLQAGSGSPEEDREMNWGTGSDCFSGDYGNLDCAWAAPYPATGAWYYLAWTWDGVNAIGYINGVQNVAHTLSPSSTFNGYPIRTADTVVGIGAALSSGPNLADDNFNGWIAAVRLSSGVLTPSQVANNFAAGLLAGVEVLLSAPSLTPSQSTVYQGAAVTLGLVDSQEKVPFTYQWQTDGGSGGTTWSVIPGATGTNYVLNTSNLNAGIYQYEIVLANSADSLSFTSPPVTLTVLSPSAPPTVQHAFNTGPTNVVIVFANPVTASSADNPANYAFTNGLAITSASLAPDNVTVTLGTAALAYNSNYWIVLNGIFSGGPTPVEIPSNTLVEISVLPVPGPQSVLTYQYDNTRDGTDTNEILLAPTNVNVNSFGKLFTYAVDGYVFAQPLIAANVAVPGYGTHNLLYIVTENDTVYAFDADTYVPKPYWTNSFIDPAADVVPVPGGAANGNIQPVVGITATPVIDPATGTIYVEVRTQEGSGNNVAYIHRLHALDISTGKERTNFNSPVVIQSTNYPGTGTPGQNDTDGAGHILWNGVRENCRPALLLANGMVYIAYASPGDHPPYYGWVFAYDAHTLAQRDVFNDDPNAGYGGIWMTGNGPAADTNGNVYLNTGNGTYDANNDYGDSILKFNGTNGLTLADYFTPYNQAMLSSQDLDVSSAGLLLLPDSVGTASHRHLLLSGSKTGALFLLDRDNLGHFNSGSDSQIVQELNGAVGGMWCSPAYFNGHIYIIGQSDYLKCFTISAGAMSAAPIAQSPTAIGYATPTISANGTNNAIVWTMNSSGGSATLYAYNATNVAQELYNSGQNFARDNAGSSVEFTLPTVANGKVYVGAQYAVSVFGNGIFIAPPTISPNGGIYVNSVSVTLSDTTPGAAIYYTLDGTLPTTNSMLYTGPFVITNNVDVQAIAAMFGAVNSGAANASFINSSSVGTGTGLLGSYWANTTSEQFTNINFTALPTLVRTDAVVNFNWDSTGPSPAVGQTVFAVRWTGSVQPQFDETYTFYATADDGVILYVNGQLLVNGWVDEAPATYQGSIPLKAQQLYNIDMEYYQNGGGAVAELQWSSLSTPEAVIPQSQLYPYSNPPPTVVFSTPANNSSYTASASVTIGAMADAPYNPISTVTFYTNGGFLATLSNSPYAPLYEVTATGLGAGDYALTAVATDGSGLVSTSAPVNITVTAGSGQPYGLTTSPSVPAYFNMPETMPGTLPGSLPLLLSQTGVFSDTASMIPTSGLIPYQPNLSLFSDNATKIRYMGVPHDAGTITPEQQINFAPTGTWSFPGGTVFVKTFELQTNLTSSNSLLRLETRLLVRNSVGGVYGVTYKWRPDYSDADLLTASSNETIVITTPAGTETNTWYYPSPADCLACHTAAANYVLGLSTRQLNASLTYPSTGVTDNELRTLNRLGLLNPAFDEAAISNFEALSALTNLTASLQQRARSYLDANCAQCHQPGGSGPTFDARYDTPLASQHITNYPALFSLGNDNESIVSDNDIWRSSLYSRMNIVDVTNPSGSVQMPPLARLLIDTNAVAVMGAWINSLPGAPTLAPPSITPNGGVFPSPVSVTLQSTNSNATLYYTLDGSLPTINSFLYSAPFTLTNTATLTVNAFWTGFNNSIASSALFIVNPPVIFTSEGFAGDGQFQLGFSGMPGYSYVLQGTTNLIAWTSLSTNTAATNVLNLIDPSATNFPYRFYRVLQQ